MSAVTEAIITHQLKNEVSFIQSGENFFFYTAQRVKFFVTREMIQEIERRLKEYYPNHAPLWENHTLRMVPSPNSRL